jgi:signal transduction histidine kinase
VSFRARIFLILSTLAVIGVVLLAAFVVIEMRRDGEIRVRQFESEALATRREHLRSLTEMASGLAEYYSDRARKGEFSSGEARARFLAGLAAMRYDGGKGYFWIHEFQAARTGDTPLVVMHPTSPAVVGKSIDQFVDFQKLGQIAHEGRILAVDDPELAADGIRASAFLLEMNRAVAGRGEAFATYYWTKPLASGATTSEGYPKLSHVKLIPDWNWVVGSGIYLDDIENAVIARRKVVQGDVERLVAATCAFLLAVLLINLVLAGLIARYLTRPIQNLSARARAITEGRYLDEISLADFSEVRDVQDAFAVMSRSIRDREEELRTRAAELQTLNRDLQVLNRAKSMILANVSHELKTPLVSIRGYIELLLNGAFGPVTDMQREKLLVCTRNADTLVSLINELLSLSEAASRIHGPKELVDLREISQHAVETMRPKAEEKKIRIEERSADHPVRVRVERDRIARVLINLLSNAVKFSVAGKRITVSTALSSDGMKAIIEVLDEGIGISAEDQKRIFEEFYQVDGGFSRKHGGLGLGLAIVKVIVEESGGGVDIRSEPGRGTAIIVSLPVAEIGVRL